MGKRIANYWCQRMHKRTMWPIHGRYVCRQCGRQFLVNWDRVNWDRPAKPRADHEYEKGRLHLTSAANRGQQFVERSIVR